MALPFADVHQAMLAEFGEPAVLRQQGEPDQDVTLIWKGRAFQIEAEGEAGISSSAPSVALPEAGLARELAAGDVFVVRGVTYRAWDVQRTGEGWARCPLHKVVGS